MSDIDNLWGELDAKRPIRLCGRCGSCAIGFNGSKQQSECMTCHADADDIEFVDAVALTKSDLSALVERVRGEEVRDKILNDNFIEQLP